MVAATNQHSIRRRRRRNKAASAAAATTALTGTTVAASAALAVFFLTSLVLHSTLNQEGSGLGAYSHRPFSFGHEREQQSASAADDPLASGSATRKSRARNRNRNRQRRARGGGFGGGGERESNKGPRMDGTVNLDETYAEIRAAHEKEFPPPPPLPALDTEAAAAALDDDDRVVRRLKAFAASIRTHDYEPISTLADGTMPYDVNDCPPTPPNNYPMAWPVLDVLANWNPDDTDDPHSHKVYQGLCRFDATTEYEKALTYRRAELPFVIRDDPVVLPTVERWNQPDYLTSILGRQRKYRTDYAKTNQLMFYRTSSTSTVPENWEEPTTVVDMSFPEWLDKANNPNKEELDPDRPHWYFRINAKDTKRDAYLYEEMPFFQPFTNFYMVDPTDARGINCRFGMRGNTAENHFDSSRNFIALFGGERRYLLSHPNQCPNLALYPMGHPSARHSEVNWADPDLRQFPQFRDARVNEVVLQAGDVLYLPTSWFHHIVSLDTNLQCNARSGVTQHYAKDIRDCGFRGVQPVSRQRQA